MISNSISSNTKLSTWVRRWGMAGFLFFMIKGLAWLTLPVLVIMAGGR